MPIYILLSFSGEYFANLLHEFFGFPSPRTCRTYKKELRQKYGIDDYIFDGSCESIEKLIQLFWTTEDKRCVISVDAVSVNAKLSIHKDGTTEGLLEEEQLENDIVDLINTNLDAFDSFYNEHKDKITKKKTNGAADQNITADLEELVAICQDIGMEVIGISFDGDPSYLHYIDHMCTDINKISKLNVKLPLSFLFTGYKGSLVFEDPLHLVNCDRYRLSCGSLICSSLSNDDESFSVDDLISIGVKPYILDHQKLKKWTIFFQFYYFLLKILQML